MILLSIDEDDISFEDDEDEPDFAVEAQEEIPIQVSAKSATAEWTIERSENKEMTSDDDNPEEQKPIDDIESD